jgi:hypothetical protein
MGEIRPDQPADDAQGHIRARLDGNDEVEIDDTEGHLGHRGPKAVEEEDDTEGHLGHRGPK